MKRKSKPRRSIAFENLSPRSLLAADLGITESVPDRSCEFHEAVQEGSEMPISDTQSSMVVVANVPPDQSLTEAIDNRVHEILDLVFAWFAQPQPFDASTFSDALVELVDGSSETDTAPLLVVPGSLEPPAEDANASPIVPATEEAEVSAPTLPPVASIESPLPEVNVPTTDPLPSEPVREIDQSLENEVLRLVNAERASFGLPPVVLDSDLSAAASDHSADMNRHDFFSHVSPVEGKERFFQRASNFGTSARSENIAWGYSNAEDVVQGWMDSPGHRANILDPTVTRMGVGEVGQYWTQMFGL